MADSGQGFAILGGGPVALACALLRARLGPVRLLAPATAPARVPRIEVVPAQTLALLVDLGVHPHALGVRQLERRRWLAWEGPQPVELDMAAAAHLQRPALEQALWAQVASQPAIRTSRLEAAPAVAEARRLAAAGGHVIDATGRCAALADTLARAPHPWVARLFHVASPRAPAPFMAAAQAGGYVYRAQGLDFATVGLVGRGGWLRGAPGEVRERLAQGPSGWIVEDIPGTAWADAGAWPAGLQWREDGAGLAIGDAALARDALSSQGLANGLSDACHAATARDAAGLRRLQGRLAEGRLAHARALAKMLENCHCRNQPVWREYAAFLSTVAT